MGHILNHMFLFKAIYLVKSMDLSMDLVGLAVEDLVQPHHMEQVCFMIYIYFANVGLLLV